jgi:glycoside/pentoside/hexuronide:cation symporter, GPH family
MNTDERLSLREMLAYGCGDFASVLFWQTFMRYLPFFYTDVFGISAASLATMLLVSRVVDGLFDPAVGVWADRTQTRWGKFRPFVLFGAAPFALVGVFTFTTPNFGPSGKLLWAYLTYNGLMLMYTVVNIPYTAMLGVMTTNSAERTRLSSIKFIFAFSAGMVISAVLLPLVHLLGDAGSNPQRGWQLSFVLIGAVAFLFFMLTVSGTRERILPRMDASVSLARDLSLLVTNRAWLLLLATTLTWVLFHALRSSVFAHYFKYNVFDGDASKPLSFFGWPLTFDGLVSAMNTGGQAASIAGVVAAAALAPRFPKRAMFIACFVASAGAAAAYFLIPPKAVEALFVAELLGSCAGAPLPVLLWSMYADTADYGEWKTGRRTTGLVFSASTMGQKIGWALGPFVAFKLLSHVGFVANVEPSPDVRSSLVGLVSLGPAACAVVSLLFFAFYPLTEQRMRQIGAELDARRSSA